MIMVIPMLLLLPPAAEQILEFRRSQVETAKGEVIHQTHQKRFLAKVCARRIGSPRGPVADSFKRMYYSCFARFVGWDLTSSVFFFFLALFLACIAHSFAFSFPFSFPCFFSF